MIIKTLLLKDFYEYKNNFFKFFGTLSAMIIIPVIVFNYYGVSHIILSNIAKLTEIILIMFTTLILSETTVFQVHRNIRDGVFEKYFINRNIKKHQIFFSKYLSNLFVVFISFLLLYGINELMGLFVSNPILIEIGLNLFLQLTLATGIATTIAFISSLLVNDEKNAMIYTFSLLIVYIGYYKVLETFKITSYLGEIFGLVILLIILSFIVIFLLNQNRFIRRQNLNG